MSEAESDDFEDNTQTYDSETVSFKPTVLLHHHNKSSSMYSPWMTIPTSSTSSNTNINSLAAELFSSMAKEYRNNNNLSQSFNHNTAFQVSQSSDFIRKVKQKMITKQIPGSLNVDSMQSDSELENYNMNEQQRLKYQQQRFFNLQSCPTPADSILSTGSGSMSLFTRSYSTNLCNLPEKLQIVKPIGKN